MGTLHGAPAAQAGQLPPIPGLDSAGADLGHLGRANPPLGIKKGDDDPRGTAQAALEAAAQAKLPEL
jgi:hypothetical protein